VGDDMGAAVICYREYKLYLKTLSGGILCVVASNDVNMPAMRMAANLVGRRITPVLESGKIVALEAPAPAAAAPAAHPPRAAALAPPGMRRFRGRTLE